MTSRMTLLFAMVGLWAGAAGAEPAVTVLQSYYTYTPEGCRVDVLGALPEGVDAGALSQASAALRLREERWTSAGYQKEDREHFDFRVQPQEGLGGFSASFSLPDRYDCTLSRYDDARLILRIGAGAWRSEAIETSAPWCQAPHREDNFSYSFDTSNPCSATATPDELWDLLSRAEREQTRQAAEHAAERQEERDLEAAGKRFTKRLEGDIALRHPTLLGIKTGDTLGKYGVRYEPVGFFTLGATERLDLGLGVRSFKAGEERLFFPGVEAKLQLLREGKYAPAVALSASGNTLMKDRALPQGTGGLRLGSSAPGGFAEEAQRVGDTQFTLGLHATRDMGILEGVAGRPRMRVHGGALYAQTLAAKGSELGAQLGSGEDVLLSLGLDFTSRRNLVALLAEGTYSLAQERLELSGGFRLSLAGITTDLGVGFTGAEQGVVDGALVELPARFYPRLGFSYLF